MVLVELPSRIIIMQSRKLKGYEVHSKYKRGNVSPQFTVEAETEGGNFNINLNNK
ncbi:hypothetical protein FPKKO176_contig00124-0006 [Flavobacterium psychrophilum]|nr:hypothetical protein FPKKO176_contig00124-0006 [Flavobacterium psychrophilum]GEJ55190.1 hypothetical protein FPKHI175_contig00121-0004 [Flavobacterium psychrophilum]